VILIVVVVLVGAGLFFYTQATAAGSEQPINYSHQLHIQAGAQCLFCHTQAARSPIAGVPSVEKCMGCHQAIALPESEELNKLNAYWEKDEPIPWVRVNKEPDFVYFSHQPHLGAGINCETCHGNVSAADIAPVMEKMDMGWCLDCHKQMFPEEDIARAVDCLTCHQ